MAASVLDLGSLAPRSIFLIEISEMPDATANSACFHPISARAARICPAVIMSAKYAAVVVGTIIAVASKKNERKDA
jgi:hypothetical protein